VGVQRPWSVATQGVHGAHKETFHQTKTDHLPSSCFFFLIYFYLCFRHGGGDRRGGMRRPGGLVATKPGIRAKGTVAEQRNGCGETRVRRTKRKTRD
jgi:hypothetical protein